MARTVFSTTIAPLDRMAQCDEQYWQQHIIANHPLMIGHEVDVEAAVRVPDVITFDAGHPRRRCLYKYNVGIVPYSPHLKVVVELNWFRKRARVITAYPVDRLKVSEAIAWQPSPPLPPP